MSRWWRAYDEALDDPKLQRLPAELFKAWFNLLCLASRNGGNLPPADSIAFSLRLSEKDVIKKLSDLEKSGLLDRDGETLRPHNWSGRQFESDRSTGRVRKFRERQKDVSRNADETFHGTPPETETETETETEASKLASERAAPDDPAFKLRLDLVDLFKRHGRALPPAMGREAVWLAQGYPAELCLAVVRSKMPGAVDKGLAWFDKAIAEAHASKPPPSATASQATKIRVWGSCAMPPENLERAVRQWVVKPTSWLPESWGPPPPENPVIVKFATDRGIELKHVEAAE